MLQGETGSVVRRKETSDEKDYNYIAKDKKRVLLTKVLHKKVKNFKM